MVVHMKKRMLKTETELEKLLADTRKMKREIKRIYNPIDKKVIINGTEIMNFRSSGFPKFNDLVRVLEQLILKGFQPISIVIEDSMKYLLENEEEESAYNDSVKNGLKIKSHTIKIVESSDNLSSIKQMLKIAVSDNLKIVSNENLVASYNSIALQDFEGFENKKWQINYSLKKDEINIYEKK